jgi:haloacetate dehalogenase
VFEGFDKKTIEVDGIEIPARVGGDGPPVLLMHGNPFNHLSWNVVAPILAERFTVVCTDLRGYGDASKPPGTPPGEPDHAAYSFRAMAGDQVAVMRKLGFGRFMAAGHDRGARVLHRMCLDHPDSVERATFLDIIPTHHLLNNLSLRWARFSWHWTFMAQPFDFPERLMGSDPEYFIRKKLSKTPQGTSFFHPDALADYIRCIKNPATIHAMCEDYRATVTLDLEMDNADFAAGRRIACPVQLLWGATGGVGRNHDPMRDWAPYAETIVTGTALPGGHYIGEECGEETAAALRAFLEQTTLPG